MEDLMRIALSNAALASVAAGLAWIAGRLAKKPALTHTLWLIVLLKLVTPPIWSVPVHLPADQSKAAPVSAPAIDRPPAVAPEPIQRAAVAQVDASSDQAVAEDTAVDPDSSAGSPAAASVLIAPAILWTRVNVEQSRYVGASSHRWIWLIGAAIWSGGIVVSVGVSIGRIARFRQILRFAHHADVPSQERADLLSAQLGLGAGPRVQLVPGAVCPMLWSAGAKPRVLVPAGLWARLDLAQRDTLLLHELAHLRRRDHWVRWLELAVTAVYWWHPVVWWARHELREAEEQCCDAWVLWAMPGSFREYASALLEAVDFVSVRRSVPVLASGMGQFGHLRRRLTMLKQGNVARALTWSGFAAACGAGALLLSVAPTLAQNVRTETKTDETITARTPIVTESPEAAAKPAEPPAAEKSDEKSLPPAAPVPPTPAALPATAASAAPLFTPRSEDAASASPDPEPRALPHARVAVRIDSKDVQFRDDLSNEETADGADISANRKRANEELANARREVQDLSRQLQQAAQRLAALERAQAKIDLKNYDVETRDGRVAVVRPKPALPPVELEQQLKPGNMFPDPRAQASEARALASQARSNADRERRLAALERQLSQLLNEVKQLRNQGPDEPATTPPTPRERQAR